MKVGVNTRAFGFRIVCAQNGVLAPGHLNPGACAAQQDQDFSSGPPTRVCSEDAGEIHNITDSQLVALWV